MRIYKIADTFAIQNRQTGLFFLLGFILLAILIRTHLNFSQELIPGVNGGYYPLLARNLLDFNSVRYPDAPLVHWLIAGISWLIGLLTDLTRDQSVIAAAKLFDSAIPPLTAIPVYLASREILGCDRRQLSATIILPGFSILYLAPLLFFCSDMVKNSLGMVWFAFFLYFFIRFQVYRHSRDLLITGGAFVVTGLTHIGTFAVEMVFALICGIFYLIRTLRTARIRRLILAAIIVSGIVLVSLFLLRGDPDRQSRLSSFYCNPLRIFEFPYLFLLMDGQNPYTGILWFNFLLINILSIAGFILLMTGFKDLDPGERLCSLSLSALCLFVSSPLIGIEWTLRYHLMAYLPLVFLYLYLFKLVRKRIFRIIMISVFGLMTAFSVWTSLASTRQPAITLQSYEDLKRIGETVEIRSGDLIVARHGLEWWTGWVLGCRTGKEYCLSPKDWDRYNGIYLLRQKKGNNYPGHRGTGQFAEFRIPESSIPIYSSEYFDLFKLAKPSPDEFYPGELPLLQGRIESIRDHSIIILSDGYLQEVVLSGETLLPGLRPGEAGEGMMADVWGRRIPFSLKILADTLLITN